MGWAKWKIFYKHDLTDLTATTTASGYDVDNLIDWQEDTWWVASNTTTPMYIYPASGPGNGSALTADYLGIYGHNLGTIGATVTLEKSDTGVWGGEEINVTDKTPTDDLTFVNEFTLTTEDYWRLKITGSLSAPPEIAICVWGQKTELERATGAFDPDREDMKLEISRTNLGFTSGKHVYFSDRVFPFERESILTGDTLDQEIDLLWKNHGLANLFLVWESTLHGVDAFLTSLEGPPERPLIKNTGGNHRRLKLPFRGLKE